MNIIPLLQSLQYDVKTAKERLAAAKADRAELKADAKLVTRIAGRSGYVRGYITGYSAPRLWATIHLTVSNFKFDRKLIRVLERALEIATAKGSEDYVSEHLTGRSFNFDLPNGGKLTVEARLNDAEAKNCRKVKTGVELREVATYAIECD